MQSKMGVRIVSCLALLMFSCAIALAAPQKTGFKTLKPAAVEYSVEIPGEPVNQSLFVPVGENAIQVSAWDAVAENVRYQLIAFGKASFSGDFANFTQALQQMFAESNQPLTLDRQVEANGVKANQYKFKIDAHEGVLRLYEGDKLFYAAIATGATETDASVARFFDSFKLGSWREPGSFPDEKRKGQQPNSPPSPWNTLSFDRVKTVQLGVLNGKAIEFPGAPYPKNAKGSGRVVVKVLVDEAGLVSVAQPVEGPSEFFEVAREAALKARFNPASLGGRRLKISGVLIYAFVGR